MEFNLASKEEITPLLTNILSESWVHNCEITNRSLEAIYFKIREVERVNKNIILTIVQKDIKATFSSKKVWVPMIITALLICIVIPSCIAFFGLRFDLVGSSAQDIEKPINAFINEFPNEEMRNTLSALPTLNYKFVFFS